MLSPGADKSSTRWENDERGPRRSPLTAYNNDCGDGVDGDTNSDAERKVQAITDFKIDPCRGVLYRVVWVGDWDDSWEPPEMLKCPDLVNGSHQCNPEKPSLTMEGRLGKG